MALKKFAHLLWVFDEIVVNLLKCVFDCGYCTWLLFIVALHWLRGWESICCTDTGVRGHWMFSPILSEPDIYKSIFSPLVGSSGENIHLEMILQRKLFTFCWLLKEILHLFLAYLRKVLNGLKTDCFLLLNNHGIVTCLVQTRKEEFFNSDLIRQLCKIVFMFRDKLFAQPWNFH